MIFDLLEQMRRWDTHISSCEKCALFDMHKGRVPPAPELCGIGRAIILDMLNVLKRGM